MLAGEKHDLVSQYSACKKLGYEKSLLKQQQKKLSCLFNIWNLHIGKLFTFLWKLMQYQWESIILVQCQCNLSKQEK